MLPWLVDHNMFTVYSQGPVVTGVLTDEGPGLKALYGTHILNINNHNHLSSLFWVFLNQTWWLNVRIFSYKINSFFWVNKSINSYSHDLNPPYKCNMKREETKSCLKIFILTAHTTGVNRFSEERSVLLTVDKQRKLYHQSYVYKNSVVKKV